jgi:hypothetical protein
MRGPDLANYFKPPYAGRPVPTMTAVTCVPFRRRHRLQACSREKELSSGSPVDRYVFCFSECFWAVVGTFAANPALLDSSERGGGIRYHAAIEADHAAFQPFADLQSRFEV